MAKLNFVDAGIVVKLISRLKNKSIYDVVCRCNIAI